MQRMYNKQEIYSALAFSAPPLSAGDFERFSSVRGEAWPARQIALVRKRAAAYLNSPTPALPYSLFRLYWDTGDRLRFQAPYYERRGRLLVFSLMAWLEPREASWLHALEDILWELCAEPFWCIPAHFVDGESAPLPFEKYAAQLDLFSAETGFAIAESLALNESRLAPDVVRQAQAALEKRIFAPFLDSRVFYRFEAMQNNWSAVCGAAIGGAALYRMEDRAALASVLHRCLSCLEVYLSSFGDDGVCVEGVGYWTYGFGFYACFADLLCQRTGGRLDLLSHPKAAAIARSQQYFYLGGPQTVSFADGADSAAFRMGLACRLQKRFPDAAIPPEENAGDLLGDGCFRFCLALRDLVWYEPGARFGLPEGDAVWLPDAQWFISRGKTLTLAAKAGHNGESHNHNDCGSFILSSGGDALVCDLGAGLYDAAYFGPNRYDLFVNASRSHNVPLIGGCEQCAGAQFAARQVRAEAGETARLEMELAGCYPAGCARSFLRVIEHDRAAGRVTLTDDFTFDAPQSVTEVFLSRRPIRLEDGRAVLSGPQERLFLLFDSEQWAPSVLEETYSDHYGATQTAWLLHLKARSPAFRTHSEIIFVSQEGGNLL